MIRLQQLCLRMKHYMHYYCTRLRRRTVARVFARATLIYCERSFPTLTLRRRLSSGDKVCFPPAPTEILWMTAVIRGPFYSVATFRATIEQHTKVHMAFLARVSWLNIGPVAAGPAGPAPTALNCRLLRLVWTPGR